MRFSEAVGLLASPDETLRALASQVQADAFVLGYQDGKRYVRTRHVVLNRGYFEQQDVETGTSRPKTEEEKQSLLLHELLHIALNKDDDALNQRDLCPLRLLTFCPRTPAPLNCKRVGMSTRCMFSTRVGQGVLGVFSSNAGRNLLPVEPQRPIRD